MKKKNITRREFVATLAAGTGFVIAGNKADAASVLNIGKSAGPLQTVSLGRTGIKTSLLGMGTGFNGGNRSSAITRAGTAETVIRYAFDRGIRLFDCADSYGTHPFVFKALKEIPREQYTLVSKIWVLRGGIPEPERPDADIVLDRFRKELNTDYIDVVQLHCMTSGTWTDDQKKQMDILETLKARKIIRAHGVSVHSLQALEAAANSPWVDVIHVRINPYGASMDSKDPDLVVPLIRKMHDSGKGIIGMKLIGNGSYSADPEKIDKAIKYVLGLGTVDLVIVGFEKQGQVDNYIERMTNALKS